MPRKTRKTKPFPVSLTEIDEEYVSDYIEKKNYTSRSEVIRHALQYAHEHEFPAYVHKLTPAAELKKIKLAKVKTFEEMSDYDYAKSLGAVILTSQEGTQWAFFHQIGNSIKGYLVESLKSLKDDLGFQSFINFHKSRLEEQSIGSLLYKGDYWRKELLNEYDIILPENDPDERDDNQNSGLSDPPPDSSLEAERVADSDNEGGESDRVSATSEGRTAGYSGDNAADGTESDDRSQDGEGQAEGVAESVSTDSGKVRSHSPHS